MTVRMADVSPGGSSFLGSFVKRWSGSATPQLKWSFLRWTASRRRQRPVGPLRAGDTELWSLMERYDVWGRRRATSMWMSTPWISGWHLLGAELWHWRLVCGLSQTELDALTHDSSALIAKVEKALRRPARDLVHRHTALDAAGALEEVWAAADCSDSADDVGSVSGDVSAIASPTVAPVGEAEVERMLVMARAFADADHRSSGGHMPKGDHRPDRPHSAVVRPPAPTWRSIPRPSDVPCTIR
jgi:hypothetical protein